MEADESRRMDTTTTTQTTTTTTTTATNTTNHDHTTISTSSHSRTAEATPTEDRMETQAEVEMKPRLEIQTEMEPDADSIPTMPSATAATTTTPGASTDPTASATATAATTTKAMAAAAATATATTAVAVTKRAFSVAQVAMNFAKKRYRRVMENGDEGDADDNRVATSPRSTDNSEQHADGSDQADGNTKSSEDKEQQHAKYKRRGSRTSYHSVASSSSSSSQPSSVQQQQGPHDGGRFRADRLAEVGNKMVLPFRGLANNHAQSDSQESPSDSTHAATTATPGPGTSNTTAIEPVPSDDIIRTEPPSMDNSTFRTINVRGLSFDIEDDDNDDAMHVGGNHAQGLGSRQSHYKIEFTQSYESNEGSASVGNNSTGTTMFQTPTPATCLTFRYHQSILSSIWFTFQSMRQEARQRRAQRLLEESDDTWQTQAWMCCMTSCDDTDRGIAIVVGCLLFWSVLIWCVRNPAAQRRIAWIGICLLTIRVSARPIYNHVTAQQPIQRIGELDGPQSPNSKASGKMEMTTIDETRSSTSSSSSSQSHHDPTVHCV